MEKVVESILRSMSSVNRPQLLFIMTLMSVLMVFRGKATFRNLSRYCRYSEKSFSRWYHRDFDFTEFNVKLLDHEIPISRDRIAAIDASFVAKSGKHTEGLGKFYNGSKQKAERGLELSNICMIDLHENTAYSLDVRQTIDSDDPDEPRTIQYAEQIRQVSDQLKSLNIKHLAADAAYSNQTIVSTVCSAGLHHVGRLRIDSDLKWMYQGPHGRRGRPKKYDGKVALSNEIPDRLDYDGELDDGSHIFSAVVWSVNLKRKIKIVLLHRVSGSREAKVLLFSTDLNLDSLAIICYYKARFQIEFLFRDAKQYTGLVDCQSRTKEAIKTHLNASLMALNLMKLEDRRANNKQGKNVISIASWKRKKFNENLMAIIFDKLDLSPTCEKIKSIYKDLSNYGAIAA